MEGRPLLGALFIILRPSGEIYKVYQHKPEIKQNIPRGVARACPLGGVDDAKARFADSKVYICRLPANGKYFGKLRRTPGWGVIRL